MKQNKESVVADRCDRKLAYRWAIFVKQSPVTGQMYAAGLSFSGDHCDQVIDILVV